VSTASTKSKRGKQERVDPRATTGKGRARYDAQPAESPDVSDRAWLFSALIILCVGAFLRFYDLALVPLHHDEGVNGNFLVRLVKEGKYFYDPANYHGPTLYYITAVISWIIKFLFGDAARDTYGLNTITIRLVPAVFGLATIVLVFCLRRQLGSIAVLAAGLLLALSPGAVYLSRYFIHETLFVFFTLGIVVAGQRFYEKQNPGYLMLAAVSAAMLFATKETAMISAGVLIIALVVTHLYVRFYRQMIGVKGLPARGKNDWRTALDDFVNALGGPVQVGIWIVLAALVFLTVYVLFYSSFFTNWKGVNDSLKTFEIWTKTGKKDHIHPFITYFYWLMNQEKSLLFLGTIGAAITVLKPKNSFALFSALWAFGLLTAYCLVPYKTPWLALNFILPLALIAGYAIEAIWEMDRRQWRLPVVIMLAATGWSVYQTVDLNFFNYDNDNEYYVYVYAHTKRGTTQLVKEVERLAQQIGQGKQTGITIVSRDYWPLPWYLRDFSRVGYYGEMTSSTEPIIIASETQKAEMEARFGDQYVLVLSGTASGGFDLRPGVTLLLYVRRGVNP